MSFITDVLVERLIADGIATSGAAFADFLPESPDAALALWDSAGTDRPALSCVPVTAGRLQLFSRGPIGDVVNARRSAWIAYQALHTLPSFSAALPVGAGATATLRLLSVHFDGPPSLIERDHTQRPLFSANATCWYSIGTVS